MLCCHPAAACRLHVYACEQEDAQVAVSLLAQLSQLSAVSLGVHSCYGSELDGNYPNIDTRIWEVDLVQLPPLGSLTALMELLLAGKAALPPDFRQLGHVWRLIVVDAHGEDWAPFHWGTESLAGLASLTCMEALYRRWQGKHLPGKNRSQENTCLPAACPPACWRFSHFHAATAAAHPPCRSGRAGFSAPPGRGARPRVASQLAGAAGGAAPRCAHQPCTRRGRPVGGVVRLPACRFVELLDIPPNAALGATSVCMLPDPSFPAMHVFSWSLDDCSGELAECRVAGLGQSRHSSEAATVSLLSSST